MDRVVTLGVTVSAILAFALAGVPARACDCMPLDPEEGFSSSDAVFLGRLVAQEPDFPFPTPLTPFRWLDFEVLQSWKGVTGTQVTVITEPGGSFAGCGLWGSTGDAFLIFATVEPGGGQLEVPGCSWLNVGYGAEEAIVELEQLGNEPLTLIDGSDPEFPLTSSAQRGGLCGSGVLAFMLPLLFAFLVAERHRNHLPRHP